MNWLVMILESSLFNVFGSFLFIGIAVFVLCLFILVWRGMDFRYAFMVLTPSLAQISKAGWFPIWFEPVLWFFVVGFGLYLGWKALTPSY